MTLLRPPASLLARVRWLFLLLATGAVVSLLVRVIGHSGRPLQVRVTVVVLLVLLSAYWVRAYQRSSFPLAWLPFEVLVIGLCAVGPDQPVMGVGVLYSAVAFRASYSSWRRAISYIALCTLSYVFGVLLATTLSDVDVAIGLAPLPGVPVMGLVVHLVAVASQQAERATARERIVSRAGLAIVMAQDPEQVRHEGLAAVGALLRDVDGARVHFVIEAERSPAPPDGARLALPLCTSDRRLGTLLVDSDRSLPVEVRDALETVSTQLALGLSAATATADLRHRATHDPLTDLANRAGVDAAITEALAAASTEAALLLMDLDGFKQVNDRHGHAVGDLLLLAVADRLRAVVRSTDLVARLGGDEFVVLLHGQGATEQASRLADRIRSEISVPVPIGGVEVTVGVSVGVAVAHPDTTTDTLLRAADADMYQAKRDRKALAVA